MICFILHGRNALFLLMLVAIVCWSCVGKRLSSGDGKKEDRGRGMDSVLLQCDCLDAERKGGEGKGYGVVMGRVIARYEGPFYAPPEMREGPWDTAPITPGGWIVDVKVCAMNVCDTSVRYCDWSKGEVYALRLPVGCYYIYAEEVPGLTPNEGYYTNSVLCGNWYGCVEKEILLPVKVGVGDTVRGIDPISVAWFELYMIKRGRFEVETLLFRSIR